MERIQTAIEKARSQREQERNRIAALTARHDAAAAPASDAAPPQQDMAAPAKDQPLAVEASPPQEGHWPRLTPFEPDEKLLKRNRVLTLHGGRDSVAFDQLRTKVIQTMRANDWTRMAITSPAPGCGKSTVALNLAFSLARQPDLRSILLEMDLRRPALGRLMGLRPDHGIADWLEGKVPFADHALRYHTNMALALCTTPRHDASDLLLQSRTGAALAQMELDYAPDLMIFDMPPLQASDDMMAFSTLVDCVLIVAGAEQSTIKQIDACERDLAQRTNVMGVVLNKCQFMNSDSGYGTYYYNT